MPLDQEWNNRHIGRHWPGTYRTGTTGTLEDECPCPKEPCGHVAADKVDPDCDQHPIAACRTMRSIHFADDCPGAVSE